MKQKTPLPVLPQVPGGHPHPTPTPDHPQTLPVEPIEVLGRHKNTGQKDHKGAR